MQVRTLAFASDLPANANANASARAKMAANRTRAFLIGKVHNIYANLCKLTPGNLCMAYPWKTNAESLRLVLHTLL